MLMLRWYLPLLGVANLAREVLHLALYTVWAEGTWGYLAFIVLHCTVGDLLIGGFALLLAVLLFAPRGWPLKGFGRVVACLCDWVRRRLHRLRRLQ
jgi:hypothetical protein